MNTETIERASEVVGPAGTREVATQNPLLRIKAGIDALAVEAKAIDLSATALATVAGDKAVRAFRLKCVRLRTGADEAYETVNRPLLTQQREARSLLADIKAAIAAIEDPADMAIKASEAAAEQKRLAKIEAERQRVVALRERIDSIAAVARRAVGKSAADIESKIKLLVGVPIGDDFAELKTEAERVHAETLASLREMHAAVAAQEAESARLAAERAELERQRAEQEAQAAAARQAAEQKAAAERAEADRVAREAREAEERRLAAERAELQRQQEEAAAARRAEEEAAAAKRRREQQAADAAAENVRAAAPQMLAVLKAWQLAEETKDTAALRAARQARDVAIATAEAPSELPK